jgi:predicted dehydrogenase
LFKSLLIGCGNIGALYDFENDSVSTHAKAYHNHPDFQFSVYDINKGLAKKVAEKYNAEQIDDIDQCDLSGFDCISICSPTDTHVDLLKRAIDLEVKLIICEKPITNKATEIDELVSLYKNSKSKILINYFRRFVPAYIDLKNDIAEIAKSDVLTNISIRYQRGFLNNCSHALDLINFLLNNELNLTNIMVNNVSTDHFITDPTISLTCYYNGTYLNILGLSKVEFSHFEIDLYFKYHKIEMNNAGQNIKLYSAKRFSDNLQPLKQRYAKENCIQNYMSHVLLTAHKILTAKQLTDNFIESLNLNGTMLSVFNKLQ